MKVKDTRMQDGHRIFFENRAKSWNDEDTSEKINRLESIFKTIPLKQNNRILDIGAGTGILIPVLLEQMNPSAELFELDFSREMMRHNYRYWHGFSNRIFHVTANAALLPIPDESIDFIIAFAVYPHIQNKIQAISEWRRVLLPAGKLLVLHLMGSTFLNRMHRDVDDVVSGDRLPTAEVLAKLLVSKGFRTERVSENDDLYLLLAEK